MKTRRKFYLFHCARGIRALPLVLAVPRAAYLVLDSCIHRIHRCSGTPSRDIHRFGTSYHRPWYNRLQKKTTKKRCTTHRYSQLNRLSCIHPISIPRPIDEATHSRPRLDHRLAMRAWKTDGKKKKNEEKRRKKMKTHKLRDKCAECTRSQCIFHETTPRTCIGERILTVSSSKLTRKRNTRGPSTLSYFFFLFARCFFPRFQLWFFFFFVSFYFLSLRFILMAISSGSPSSTTVRIISRSRGNHSRRLGRLPALLPAKTLPRIPRSSTLAGLLQRAWSRAIALLDGIAHPCISVCRGARRCPDNSRSCRRTVSRVPAAE